MAKLISTKTQRAGKEVSLAIVGVVSFNSDCEAEISDEKAKALADYLFPHPALGYFVEGYSSQIESAPSVEVDSEEEEETPDEPAVTATVDTSAKEEEEAEEEVPVEEESATDANDETSTEEEGDESDDASEEEATEGDDDVEAIVADMDVEELKAFAKDAGYPEDEWSRKKSVNSLRKYIISKVNA